jgi:hypothetical protein
MTDAIADHEIDDDDDEELGPSMAIPPIYVLRTATYCPECGQALHVYTLGCVAYQDGHFGSEEPIYDFHFLRQITSVPPSVLDLLKRKCPSYYLDHPEEGEAPYLMNHCRCGARLDDDFVSGDVAAAFWPDSPEGYNDLDLFLLPIDEPIPVESNYMLGGGEYLSLDQAEAW